MTTPDTTHGPLLPDRDEPPRARWTRADSLARADRAWRVRVAGGTWREAAEAGGYSNDSNALNAVRNVYGDLPHADRTDLRNVWRARLETLWREALADVGARRPGAVLAAVRVAQAACVLDGLNEPTTLDVNVSAARAFEEITRELVRHDL